MHGGQVYQPGEQVVAADVAALRAVVAGLDLPVDGAVLAEVLAVVDRLDAKVSALVGEFDHAGLWDLDAATSTAAWLQHRGNLTGRDARRVTHTARRLRTCPALRQGWLEGRITGGQVAAVVANVKERTVAQFETGEADIVDTITGLSVTDTTRVMAHWAAMAEAIADDQDEPEPAPNTVQHSRTLGGRSELSGSFTPDAATMIETALDEAMPAYSAHDRMSPAERRAQSMLDIMGFYLDHHRQPPGRRNRPHVNIIITEEHLASGGPGHSVDGVVIDHSIVKAMTCDANLHRVTVDRHGTVLDYGRATRTVSADLFAALTIRDGGCRWPGCHRPPKHTEAHHIVHWEHGGPTEPSNLVLLCSRHHHRLHQGSSTLRLWPDNTVEITRPGHPPERSRPPMRC